MSLNEGKNPFSMFQGKKMTSNLMKEAKQEVKPPKKKNFGGQKWKEKIQNTVERMELELTKFEEKIQQAETINELYQQFRGSSVKPILNILHEKYHAITENFVVERRSKVPAS